MSLQVNCKECKENPKIVLPCSCRICLECLVKILLNSIRSTRIEIRCSCNSVHEYATSELAEELTTNFGKCKRHNIEEYIECSQCKEKICPKCAKFHSRKCKNFEFSLSFNLENKFQLIKDSILTSYVGTKDTISNEKTKRLSQLKELAQNITDFFNHIESENENYFSYITTLFDNWKLLYIKNLTQYEFPPLDSIKLDLKKHKNSVLFDDLISSFSKINFENVDIGSLYDFKRSKHQFKKLKKKATIPFSSDAMICLRSGNFLSVRSNQMSIYELASVSKELRKVFQFEKTPCRITKVIELSDNSILSGEENGTLRVWQQFTAGKEYLITKVITVHQKEISTLLQLPNGKVCSSSKDVSVKLWSFGEDHQFKIDLTFYTKGYITTMVNYDNNYVIFGTIRGHLFRWNTNDNKWIEFRGNHDSKIENIIAINGRIVSQSEDGFVKIWEEESFEEQSWLNSFDESKILSICGFGVEYLLSATEKGLEVFKNEKGEFESVQRIPIDCQRFSEEKENFSFNARLYNMENELICAHYGNVLLLFD